MVLKRAQELKEKLNNSCDILIREIVCGNKNLNILFLKSVIDEQLFVDGIISPILDFGSKLNEEQKPNEINLDILSNEILKAINVEKLQEDSEIIEHINDFKVLIFIEDEGSVLSVDIVDYPTRVPVEPPTSAVMKGPREGFIEDYRQNVSLLRRRFAADKFIAEKLKIGRYSQTDIVVVYIKNIADKKQVKEVKNKLKKVDIDGIIDSYYLISFLQDHKNLCLNK